MISQSVKNLVLIVSRQIVHSYNASQILLPISLLFPVKGYNILMKCDTSHTDVKQYDTVHNLK